MAKKYNNIHSTIFHPPPLPQSVSSSATVRHRSSRTSSQRQTSHDRVATEMEEATLVAEGDDQPGPDEDSTWEAI